MRHILPFRVSADDPEFTTLVMSREGLIALLDAIPSRLTDDPDLDFTLGQLCVRAIKQEEERRASLDANHRLKEAMDAITPKEASELLSRLSQLRGE